ncbi:MAG TPA: hypothetical protein VK689_15760 [Armatimonadota bacterium]|nr:hypothetical protein [Armatimonadota bacterium]
MKRRYLLIAGVAAVLGALPAGAWWPRGHSIVAEAAVRALPAEVPWFFREGHGMVAHMAQDPDVLKNRETPALRDAEEPEHFIDMELLEGRTVPATRHEFLKQCAAAKLDPRKVGLLPYSVAEWTERLTMAFAEHRKWPENPYIRSKCLMYAGILSHYSGDLCMPLHTTVHHDGRLKADGTSPRTGIHAKVDSLIEKLPLQPAGLASGQKVEPASELMPVILAEIQASHAQIDRTYALEAGLPPESGPWTASPEVTAFATERARAATRFTASLYLTAWRKSAGIQLPPWLQREPPARSRR